MISHKGVSEEEILAVFGKLLAVLEYARMICSSEAFTGLQIMHDVSFGEETVDVEFVKFDSAVFAEAQSQPGEEQIIEHFDKYKNLYAGSVSEENPYGFGYKFPEFIVSIDNICCYALVGFSFFLLFFRK